jgi:nucleotide-binding universal stress UspA family protein
MTEPSWAKGPPRNILLATDMSCRCDRALDRAVQLAGQWHAKLVAIHALDPVDQMPEARALWDAPSWRRPPNPLRVARDRLHADLFDQPGDIDVLVETGKPADIILDAARRSGSDLIVTGVARDEALGRNLLGDTVDHLMRRSPVPLLIVRSRCNRPYDKIVVATDFSRSSGHAVEAAYHFFPKADFTLFNGYDLPFSGFLEKREIREEFDRMETETCDAFLKEAGVPAATAQRFVRMIEHGVPEILLREYMKQRPAHLTVVGSHGGGAIYEILIGSTARKIIDAVPGDVLLVREPKAV